MPNQSFTTPGTTSFTYKDGVLALDVLKVWAGGGGGNGDGDFAGGGGGEKGDTPPAKTTATVTVIVGDGGNAGDGSGLGSTDGGDSQFDSEIAHGGKSGANGGTGGTGDHNGGDGGAAGVVDGGGGGGAAGTDGDGGDGDLGGPVGTGAGGTAGTGGGDGANAGGAATAPAGGGCGGGPTQNAGAGARGEVYVQWTDGHLSITSQPAASLKVGDAFTVVCEVRNPSETVDTLAVGNVVLSANGGNLTGTLTHAPASGVYTFSGVKFTAAGVFNLTFTHDDGYTANSNGVDVLNVGPDLPHSQQWQPLIAQ